MELVLAVYGAVLSTVLGIVEIIRLLGERPRIAVEAVALSTPAKEGTETHGVLVQVKRGDDLLWEEADVQFCIRNAGGKACQITDVFVETATDVLQVVPKGLPVLLEPNTRYCVRVQPECFASYAPTVEGSMKEDPIAYSGQSVHSFRLKPSSHSGRNRPAVPGQTVQSPSR